MAHSMISVWLRCFNGAETKMSRKLGPNGEVVADTSQLQWGRDKNVSEIIALEFQGANRDKLQWGRDKNVSEITLAECITRRL